MLRLQQRRLSQIQSRHQLPPLRLTVPTGIHPETQRAIFRGRTKAHYQLGPFHLHRHIRQNHRHRADDDRAAATRQRCCRWRWAERITAAAGARGVVAIERTRADIDHDRQRGRATVGREDAGESATQGHQPVAGPVGARSADIGHEGRQGIVDYDVGRGGDQPGIGDADGVGRLFTNRYRIRADRLGYVEHRRLIGDGHRVGRRGRATGGSGRDVGDRTGADIGRGDRVGRAAGDRLAGVEEIIEVTNRTQRRAAFVAGSVVGDHHGAVQGRAAGVGNQETVIDHLPHETIDADVGGLVQAKPGHPVAGHGSIGRRPGRAAGGARIDHTRRHGGNRPDHAGTDVVVVTRHRHRQRIGPAGETTGGIDIRPGHADIGDITRGSRHHQRHIAGIFDREPVVERRAQRHRKIGGPGPERTGADLLDQRNARSGCIDQQ